MNWVYKVELVPGDISIEEYEAWLNDFGRNGWELIQVGMTTVTFKRPKR